MSPFGGLINGRTESLRLISGENFLFVKVVQAEAVLPHNFALGVQSDPWQLQKLFNSVGERTVGMGIIDGHDNVVVTDLVNRDR